jgi:hypothetical protein
MKTKSMMICLFMMLTHTVLSQTANYKGQLNKQLKDDVTLKVKLNQSKIEVIDKEQTPKYRKSKSLVTWTDSSPNKHQSYKQQVLPKK